MFGRLKDDRRALIDVKVAAGSCVVEPCANGWVVTTLGLHHDSMPFAEREVCDDIESVIMAVARSQETHRAELETMREVAPEPREEPRCNCYFRREGEPHPGMTCSTYGSTGACPSFESAALADEAKLEDLETTEDSDG